MNDESMFKSRNTALDGHRRYDSVRYSSFEPELTGMIRQGKAGRQSWLYIFEIFEYVARTSHILSAAIDDVWERPSLSRMDIGLKGSE